MTVYNSTGYKRSELCMSSEFHLLKQTRHFRVQGRKKLVFLLITSALIMLTEIHEKINDLIIQVTGKNNQIHFMFWK